ncbi:MAG TPA: hypothetical protein VFZ61_13780 [Polyangiales bacterium]
MTLKQFFFALCLGAIVIQAGLTCARAEPPYEVVLEDEFGNSLPAYNHRGDRFALGRDGQRYNVRIYNRGGRRVEAVVSVDGRDVLSGMPGDFKQQRGYIVPAYGSVLIDGFRTSLSSVAAFRFTSPDDSYSARMGTPENVGVIGAAFFSEAAPPPPPPAPKQIPYRRPVPYGSTDKYEGPGGGGLGTRGRASAPAPTTEAPAAQSAPAESRRKSGAARDSYAEAERSDDTSNIGTQYGEETYSHVSEVSFVRAHRSSPDRVVTLRYDDRDGLVARGILPRPLPRHARGPSAFPVNRFAPPPPPRPYYYRE